MKNIIPIFVIGILIIGGLGAVATVEKKLYVSPISDELDQFQTEMTENIVTIIGQIPIDENLTNVQVAQSFVPTKEIITRVELYIAKNITTSYPINISIRKELTEEDLTVESVDAAIVPDEEFEWVEIDIPDIVITTGQTYYLVALTENITDNFYGWAANNDSESYQSGCAWFSYDDGDSWTNESSISSSHNPESYYNNYEVTKMDEYVTWDTCFKTYGRNSSPPEAPIINGPSSARYNESQSYLFTTTDPDGDDLFYQILWGDGTSEEWIGPFHSDEIITVNHTWKEQGTYVIAARSKDIYGFVGDWTEFEVEIPRNSRFIFSIFYRFLARFSMLERLLNLIN